MAPTLFPEDPSLTHTPITQIALSRKDRGVFFLDYTSPKWLTRDLSYLHEIGGKPFSDAVAAAIFEPEQMIDDVDVYGWWRKENHFVPSHGFLDPEQMKNWR